MSKIHFLNVKNGDCSIIQHITGHISVIDVCNARKVVANESAQTVAFSSHDSLSGNFRQKEHPENPIDYLNNINCNSIFRYIQTHPDMDHMDGIKDLFDSFEVLNFWDTANNKQMNDFSTGSGYREEDWKFYQSKRKSTNTPKVLQLYPNSVGPYYNQEKDGICDGLQILAPTTNLVTEANKSGDYNDCSYVILYQAGDKKIIFAGDSAEKTWDYILDNHKERVANIDVLIAPHHGRTSGGNRNYLDILNPKLTLFGNAPSKDLDYDSWNRRDLYHITNNQAGNIILDINETIGVYVSNYSFAAKQNPSTKFNNNTGAYFIGNI